MHAQRKQSLKTEESEAQEVLKLKAISLSNRTNNPVQSDPGLSSSPLGLITKAKYTLDYGLPWGLRL